VLARMIGTPLVITHGHLGRRRGLLLNHEKNLSANSSVAEGRYFDRSEGERLSPRLTARVDGLHGSV